MSKKKQHHEEEVDEKWLLPYSDMLTLLLALFIVMFAMSSVNQNKLQKIASQFNVIMSGGSGIMDGQSKSPTTAVIPKSGDSNNTKEQDTMLALKLNLDKEIQKSGYGGKVKVTLNNDGLGIAIQDVILFNSGDADVLKSVYPLLVQISKMVGNLDNNIKIVGYTDNVPIHNGKFRSNWDLSAMRAINVMQFMIEIGKLNPDKFSVQAYGEYLPKYNNSTAEGRAMNRRVEMIIVRKYPIVIDTSKYNGPIKN